jgi:hypothetical protein
MTAGAANGEVDVLGGGDLKSNVALDEFETVAGADEPAFQIRPESDSAGRAQRRRVRAPFEHSVELCAASQAKRSLRQPGGPLVFHAVLVHFECFALKLLLVALVAGSSPWQRR